MSGAVSLLHAKMDELLLSSQLAAAPLASVAAAIPSFTKNDQDSLKLAISLAIIQGLSITDLSQTLQRILSHLAPTMPYGETVVATAVATRKAALTGASRMSSPIDVDEDDEEAEDEEEAEAEADDSSCRTAGGDADEDDEDDSDDFCMSSRPPSSSADTS